MCQLQCDICILWAFRRSSVDPGEVSRRPRINGYSKKLAHPLLIFFARHNTRELNIAASKIVSLIPISGLLFCK
jgi:MoaA/NifB/PqqE/SkfB family radical SAM enzyme